MRGNFITDRNGDKNPNYKHGHKGCRLYRIWSNIKTRCYNTNCAQFDRYGGRGISVCDEWKNSFQAFYDWSMSHGYSDELTIDRIDVNGNYEPSNCHWVTMKEQSINRSNNHIVRLNNEEKPLSEWCKQFGLNYKTVRDRLHRGWNYEKALYTPIEFKFRRKVV